MSNYYNQKSKTANSLKLSLLCLVLTLCFSSVKAQLTGTKNIPGDYATLALAVTDLNTQGVGAGGVIFNMLPSNPETAPAGGYRITATGTAANAISFYGNNNAITANGALTIGSLTDAIFKIVGGDYITIGGFVMQENAANTTIAAATNNMTEFGVALFYASATDGAQNNTIVGNIISLNRTYTNSFGVYSNTRHTELVVGTTADITSPTGANSNNKVYSNVISNVNFGITFIGSAVAANQDSGNDIGGNSAMIGNTITNWGGFAAASTFVSNPGASTCIVMNHQVSDNVSYNTITSAPVSGTAVTFRGISKDYTVTAPTGTFTSTISNNTITLTSGFTSGTFEHIRSAGITALATATININNNTILNSSITGVGSTSGFVGITNTSVASVLTINGNIIRGNTSTASSGTSTFISNTGAAVSSVNIDNNQIGNASGNAIAFSAANSGVNNVIITSGTTTANVSISNNDFRGFVYNVNGTGSTTFISYANASSATATINSNTFTNLSMATSGSIIFITRSGNMTATGVENVTNNSIVTAFAKTVAGGTVSFRIANASSVNGSVMTETGNNFSNITVTGATTIAGWSNTDGASVTSGPTKTFTGNTFSNITGGTNGVTGYTFNFGQGTTFTGNTFNNITGQGTVTGLTIGTSNANVQSYSNNTFTNISSTGTGGNVIAITGGNTSITSLTLSGNTINNWYCINNRANFN
jgi:hypothetical protein